MSDFITLLKSIEDESMTMDRFLIFMLTLIILMIVYKAPDMYRVYKEFEKDD